MTDNVAIIREFIDTWSTLDADKLSKYFTEDGVYHNMPAQPVKVATSMMTIGTSGFDMAEEDSRGAAGRMVE